MGEKGFAEHTKHFINDIKKRQKTHKNGSTVLHVT